MEKGNVIVNIGRRIRRASIAVESRVYESKAHIVDSRLSSDKEQVETPRAPVPKRNSLCATILEKFSSGKEERNRRLSHNQSMLVAKDPPVSTLAEETVLSESTLVRQDKESRPSIEKAPFQQEELEIGYFRPQSTRVEEKQRGAPQKKAAPSNEAISKVGTGKPNTEEMKRMEKMQVALIRDGPRKSTYDKVRELRLEYEQRIKDVEEQIRGTARLNKSRAYNLLLFRG
jgi:hypothetical protein